MDKFFTDKVLKSIQVLVALVGVTIPTILLTGYIYHLGFTSYFGLDSSLVPRDFSGMITESWYLGAKSLSSLLPYLWYAFLFLPIFFIFVLGLTYLCWWLKGKDKLWILDEVTKEEQGRRILGLSLWVWNNLFDVTGKLTLLICTAALIPLIILLMLIAPFQAGANDAEALSDRYKTSGCADPQLDLGQPKGFRPVECMSLIDISDQDGKPLIKGIYISSNESRIAIFQGKSLEVYPLSDQYKISKFRQLEHLKKDE